MRLLLHSNTDEFSLTEDLVGDDTIPPYAILSHTWKDGQEVTFKDLMDGTGKSKTGYNKIRFCGQQAERDGLQYFWVDTCCIDKSNSAELSEAIISMFRWYRDAAKCYVYLADVSTTKQDPTAQLWAPDFQRSRWFTRGWTLQELIAPSSVDFFSIEGKLLGSKDTLEQQVHSITGIAVKALRGHALSGFSVAERLSWAEFRGTKREEDKAYSLLGIFNINMPPLYGEGAESAFRRLHEEIDKRSSSTHYKDLLDRLPCVAEAPFNAYQRQHHRTCLADTRIDLLREIYDRNDGENSPSIFRLGGLASTDKSTVAQTMAHKYSDTSAQVQYQASKQSNDDVPAAVKALSETCSSFDVPSSTEFEPVRSDVEERYHAAIKNHFSTTTETDVARMRQNIASLANHASDLADEILTENKQQMQEVTALLCSMSQAQERTIAKALRDAMTCSVTSPAGPKRQLQYHQCKKRICKNESQSKKKRSTPSYSSLPGSFPADHLGSEVSCASRESTSMSHPRIDTACCMVDASRAFCALLFTVLYANPQSRKLAGRLWMDVQADPVLALLCLICVALVQRCLLHVPKHISLLSDNSIAFEDVFGIEIRVPYRQCEQFEFFHGFLEYYFRQKPGLQRVMQKRYRLLLGNARGQIIERSTWTKMVRPKTRLTMAMLLVSAQNQCVKCLGELEHCSQGQIRICFACSQEYSVETLNAHHQRYTSTIAIDYQNSEAEQLDLPLRHPTESHNLEIAASPRAQASNMTSQSNSDQAIEALVQEVIATNNPHTRSDGSATDTSHRSKPTAKQKPESVLELELKLFKNMTIRIVPRATPLRPMLRRDEEVDDDHLSTTANASEVSPEECSERLRQEDTSFTSTIGQLGLREEDDSEPKPFHLRDDMFIATEPTRYVDYLSHDWDERELVLSWRYVAKRRQTMESSARLENAAWRFWAQIRGTLKTTNPASLNWLKDHDITWLYGPFQSEHRGPGEDSERRSPDSLGSLPSVHQKPILKRKSTIGITEQYTRYSFASSQPSTPPEIKHVSFNEKVKVAQAVETEDGDQDSTWTENGSTVTIMMVDDDESGT